MGLEGSKESVEYSSHHGLSTLEAIDVAAFEAEAQKIREISRMDQLVRSRFQHGVRYNMKVLLCGHTRTGKTLLWKRFQGLPFIEASATINWTSPSSSGSAGGSGGGGHSHDSSHGSSHGSGHDDAVKVEVWDVVDRAIRTERNSANRFSTADLVYTLKGDGVTVPEGKHALRLLDASAVDIYQGAHAVVFMISPFDRASLQYVQNKYPSVPGHVSILLVLNFRDKIPSTTTAAAAAATAQGDANHGDAGADNAATAAEVQVTLRDVRDLCAQIQSYRSNLATDDVTVIETSLKNGFGLLHLHHYLDIPFLRIKQRCLQEQLARVERDLAATHVNITDTVRGAHYDDYVRHHATRSRERSGVPPPPESTSHSSHGERHGHHSQTPGDTPTVDVTHRAQPPRTEPAAILSERADTDSHSSSLQVQASSCTTSGTSDSPTSSSTGGSGGGKESAARANIGTPATPEAVEQEDEVEVGALAASLRMVASTEEAGQQAEYEPEDAAEPVQDSAAAGKTGTMANRLSANAVQQAGGDSSSSEEDVGMAQKVGFGRKSLSSVRDKRKPALRKVTKRTERQVEDDDLPPVVATLEDEKSPKS